MRLLFYMFLAYAWFTLIGDPHWFWAHIWGFVTVIAILGYAVAKSKVETH